MILKEGMEASVSCEVTEEKTARAVGSGSLPVCATPVLAALMEQAAVKALADCLPSSTTSVGISLMMHHTSPTPLGHTVTVRAVLAETEGRYLTFHIIAEDEAGEVARAEHVRCLVESAPFMEKAEKKYKK